MSTEDQDGKSKVLNSEQEKTAEAAGENQEQIDVQLRAEVEQLETAVIVLESQITEDLATLDTMASDSEYSPAFAKSVVEAKTELEQVATSARGILRAFLESIPDIFYHQPKEMVQDYRANLEAKALAIPDNPKIISQLKKEAQYIFKRFEKSLYTPKLHSHLKTSYGKKPDNYKANWIVESSMNYLSRVPEYVKPEFSPEISNEIESALAIYHRASKQEKVKWKEVEDDLQLVLWNKIVVDIYNEDIEAVVSTWKQMPNCPDREDASEPVDSEALKLLDSRASRIIIGQLTKKNADQLKQGYSYNRHGVAPDFYAKDKALRQQMDDWRSRLAQAPTLQNGLDRYAEFIRRDAFSRHEFAISQTMGRDTELWDGLDNDIKDRIFSIADRSYSSGGPPNEIFTKYGVIVKHPRCRDFFDLLKMGVFALTNSDSLGDFENTQQVQTFLDSLPVDIVTKFRELPDRTSMSLGDVSHFFQAEAAAVVIERTTKLNKVFSQRSNSYGWVSVNDALLVSDAMLDSALEDYRRKEQQKDEYEQAFIAWKERHSYDEEYGAYKARAQAIWTPTHLSKKEYATDEVLHAKNQKNWDEFLTKIETDKPVETVSQEPDAVVRNFLESLKPGQWSWDSAHNLFDALNNVPKALVIDVFRSQNWGFGIAKQHEVLANLFDIPVDDIKKIILKIFKHDKQILVGGIDLFVAKVLVEDDNRNFDYVWRSHVQYSSPETVKFLVDTNEDQLVNVIISDLQRSPNTDRIFSSLEKIKDFFPFIDLAVKNHPTFILEYYNKLPAETRTDLLKRVDVKIIREYKPNLLKVAVLNPTSNQMPWTPALEKLRSVQDFAARPEHCPWSKELLPLVCDSLDRGNIALDKAEDGDLLLEYVKAFGAFNLPTLFGVFAEIKRDQPLEAVWQTESGKKARDFLGARADKVKNSSDLLNELRQIKRRIQKEILEDKIPSGLQTELGAEVFNSLRGSTAWGREDGGVETMSKTWQEAAVRNPEIARLPEGYKEVRLVVAEVGVAESTADEESKKAAKEQERTTIIGNENIKEQWQRSIKPAIEVVKSVTLSDWWAQKREKVMGELETEAATLQAKTDADLTEAAAKKGKPVDLMRARAAIESSIKKIGTFQQKWQALNSQIVDIKGGEFEKTIETLATLASQFEKDKNLRAYADEVLYAVSVVHMQTVMPEGQKDYLTQALTSVDVSEDGLIAYSQVMKQYVAEHYLHSEQKPDHVGHAGFSKDTVKKLAAIWQVGKKMDTENPLVQAGLRLQQLTNPELVATGKSREVAMVPVRGLMRIFAGDIGDACYTSQHNALAKGDFPGLTAGIMVSNRDTAQERMEGSVLFIETKTDSGEPALIVRANNPRMSLMEKVDPNDLIKQTLDYAVTVAKARGIKRVVVPRDAATASCSNRQEVAKYYHDVYKSASSVPLVDTPDTNFNGYKIWKDTCVEVWREEGVPAMPQVTPVPSI